MYRAAWYYIQVCTQGPWDEVAASKRWLMLKFVLSPMMLAAFASACTWLMMLGAEKLAVMWGSDLESKKKIVVPEAGIESINEEEVVDGEIAALTKGFEEIPDDSRLPAERSATRDHDFPETQRMSSGDLLAQKFFPLPFIFGAWFDSEEARRSSRIPFDEPVLR